MQWLELLSRDASIPQGLWPWLHFQILHQIINSVPEYVWWRRERVTFHKTQCMSEHGESWPKPPPTPQQHLDQSTHCQPRKFRQTHPSDTNNGERTLPNKANEGCCGATYLPVCGHEHPGQTQTEQAWRLTVWGRCYPPPGQLIHTVTPVKGETCRPPSGGHIEEGVERGRKRGSERDFTFWK